MEGCQNKKSGDPSTVVFVLHGRRSEAYLASCKGGPVATDRKPDRLRIHKVLARVPNSLNRALIVRFKGCENLAANLKQKFGFDAEIVNDGDLSLTCGDAILTVYRRNSYEHFLDRLLLGEDWWWIGRRVSVPFHCDECRRQLQRIVQKRLFGQQEIVFLDSLVPDPRSRKPIGCYDIIRGANLSLSKRW